MKSRPIRPHVKRDSGVALIFVLFLVAVVIIGGSAATLTVLSQGRREKETEMIWRGEQYQRAIGLFYRKFGRFPTSLDNLLKPQNGVRFLREAYKDPMNPEDGSWRFIYVTAGGQLIGSVRYISLQEMAFVDRQRQLGIPTGIPAPGAPAENPPADTGAGAFGTQPPTGFPGMPGTQSAGAFGGSSPGSFSQSQFNSGQTPGSASAGNSAQYASTSGEAQAGLPPGGIFSAPTNGDLSVNESSDSSGQAIGGFIIGVAGKIDKPSLKVYRGGKTYKQWEFIYNPLEQVQTIAVGSSGPNTTPPQNPSSPFPMPQRPPALPPQIPQ